MLSRARLFATPWIAAHQVPLSMGFSRQGYKSGLPFPPPGIFLTQGSNQRLLSPALAGRFFTTEPPEKPLETTVPLPGYKEPSVSSVEQAESWWTVNALLPVSKTFLESPRGKL